MILLSVPVVLTVCSLNLQKAGAVAMPASVVQVAHSMKEREDHKLEPYQAEMEHAMVCLIFGISYAI